MEMETQSFYVPHEPLKEHLAKCLGELRAEMNAIGVGEIMPEDGHPSGSYFHVNVRSNAEKIKEISSELRHAFTNLQKKHARTSDKGAVIACAVSNATRNLMNLTLVGEKNSIQELKKALSVYRTRRE